MQHPNKGKHHDANAMIPQHPQHAQYQTMRQMGLGTQTLGRHHHSPNHMRQNSGKYLNFKKIVRNLIFFSY